MLLSTRLFADCHFFFGQLLTAAASVAGVVVLDEVLRTRVFYASGLAAKLPPGSPYLTRHRSSSLNKQQTSGESSPVSFSPLEIRKNPSKQE